MSSVPVLEISGTHTLAALDAGKILRATGACVLTVSGVWPQGTFFTIDAEGGTVTFAGSNTFGGTTEIAQGDIASLYNTTGAAAWRVGRGPAGPQGLQGIPGDQGEQGDPGPAGSGVTIQGSDTYANITALPSPSTGDMWLLTDSGGGGSPGDGLVWDGAAWTNVGPIRGPAGQNGTNGSNGNDGTDGTDGTDGADGRTVLNGTGAPGAGIGVDGDYYIDNNAPKSIYGPKTGGAWGSATSLVGPAGQDGNDGQDGTDGTNGTNAVWTQITQAAYDALSPPDAGTLYVIIG